MKVNLQLYRVAISATHNNMRNGHTPQQSARNADVKRKQLRKAAKAARKVNRSQ
jgi:propanediol dehydratase large subunit